MTTEETTKNSSTFLTLFHRKKKINTTKSVDEIKKHSTVDNQLPSTAGEVRKTRRMESHTLPSNLERKKKGRAKSFWDTKSQSLDDLIDRDPKALLEALETIAAEQPLVARSIPKHAKITKKEDKRMKNCLFEQDVYDSMLSDSIRVCDLLQSHLDDCIVSVRAKSPEPAAEPLNECADSGRGASSPSSTMSISSQHTTRRLKSCVRADV